MIPFQERHIATLYSKSTSTSSLSSMTYLCKNKYTNISHSVLSLCLSVCPSVFLSFVCFSVCLTVFLSFVCFSVCLSVFLSFVCFSVCRSVCLFACHYVFLSLCHFYCPLCSFYVIVFLLSFFLIH